MTDLSLIMKDKILQRTTEVLNFLIHMQYREESKREAWEGGLSQVSRDLGCSTCSQTMKSRGYWWRAMLRHFRTRFHLQVPKLAVSQKYCRFNFRPGHSTKNSIKVRHHFLRHKSQIFTVELTPLNGLAHKVI